MLSRSAVRSWIDGSVESASREVLEKRENVRLTQKQLDDLRDHCRSPVSGFILRHGPAFLRARIMARIREQDTSDESGKARAPLSAEQVARIDDDARTGHRWLMEEYGLPLDRYGYGV